MKIELIIGIALLATACQRKVEPPAAPDVAPPVEAAEAAGADAAPKERYLTKHFDADGKPAYRNFLVSATSPHLRQHAHHPVEWFPWEDTALNVARTQRKPILLSIGDGLDGDSALLALEVWDDESLGKLVGERFVAVKVDRLERPDLAAHYASAAAHLTGQTGWPTTLLLTPQGDPFFAVSSLAGHRALDGGLRATLEQWATKWASDRAAVEKAAGAATAKVVAQSKDSQRGNLRGSKAARTAAARAFEQTFDETNRGWGPQKAAPVPTLQLLLRSQDVSDRAMAMVTGTLDALRMSPVHDHVGGGFFEGALDDAWQRPRPYKSLDTNAALLALYTEAWQATKSPAYAEVVRGIVGFLLRDLRADAGGFHAGLAAPVGEASGYYQWTEAQIAEAAGELAGAFALTDDGLLRAVAADAGTAQGHRDGLAALRKIREGRPAPNRDDTIITAWNGLAAGALARAGFVFDEPTWIEAAAYATKGLTVQDANLRRSRVGEAPGPPAFADDYALAIGGLLDLFEATADGGYLRRAVLLQNQFDVACWDPAGAGYFATPTELAAALPARPRPYLDGALPSANGVAAVNLWRLGAFRADAALHERLANLLNAFARRLDTEPARAPQLLTAALWRERGVEVALVGSDPHAMLEVLRADFFPFAVVARSTDRSVVPWLAGKHPPKEKSTAYVCRQGRCSEPIAEPAALGDRLRGE